MAAPRTLRRYLARRFFVAIVSAFVLCCVLIFIIDFVELLRLSGKYGSVSGGQLALMALLRLPAYTEFLIAFTVLVGSIGALLVLNRRSELTVMRSGGMSVWQLLRPGMMVAFVLGVFAVAVYNPFAAWARETAERLYASAFGHESNLLQAESAGTWLRQDGIDGQSIISAAHAANRGLKLTGVTAFIFDKEGRFTERIDADQAELREGYWHLTHGWVARINQPPDRYDTYLLSTYLTPERVQDALGTVSAVSFWELPGLIEVAEKAKLSSARLRIQYEQLLVRPLLCLAMVLLGATVSLQSFRSGGIQTMVVAGLMGGFGFFLFAEVSRQIGVAGLASPWVAIWPPVLLAMMISSTVLLYQEDG